MDAPIETPIDGAAALSDRFLGGLADLLLNLTALGLAALAMIPLGLPLSNGLWPGFAVFLLSFSFLYMTLPLAFWGQTPGMAWRGLRASDGTGLSLAFGQTVLRWLGGVLTVVLFGLPLVIALSGRSLADRLSASETRPVF